jgi:hypothetical protein
VQSGAESKPFRSLTQSLKRTHARANPAFKRSERGTFSADHLCELIGFDPEADRQNYFVTETGITVLTRDYFLFENPVAADYFTSE